MRQNLLAVLLLSLVTLPTSAAELSRHVNLAHSGEFSAYGVYDFDYGRLRTGAFGNTCAARVEPGLMYAVSENLFIGAAVQSSYSAQSTQATQQSRYSLGLAPKVSYTLNLTENLTAMPELTLGYRSGWQNRDNADLLEHAQTSSQMWATFYLPLLIAPTRLARGSFRPVLQWDVSSSLRLNNAGTPGGSFVPGGRSDAEISCQSTLGIHF